MLLGLLYGLSCFPEDWKGHFVSFVQLVVALWEEYLLMSLLVHCLKSEFEAIILEPG